MNDSKTPGDATSSPPFPWGWVVGAALVVAGVFLLLYATAEPEDTLPEVYSVM